MPINGNLPPEGPTAESSAPGLPGTALVPVPLGELVDKITILEIKSERIVDRDKLLNVHRELGLLVAALTRIPALPPQVDKLKAELRAINEALWEIEDRIRDCERRKDFGAVFIALARNVYLSNDRRGAVKRRLSQLAGSAILEEKSYVEYEPRDG
jgi:Family of unknown function (DUF6165)